MPNRTCTRGDAGKKHSRIAFERVHVILGQAAPRLVPGVESTELHAQNRCLDLVEPAVVTELLVVVAAALSVVGEHPNALGKVLVCRDHDSSIPDRAPVLRRVEAEGTGPDP